MSARRPRKARGATPVLKGEPQVDPREKVLMQTLQRAADMEFALRETQAALRKVIHHVTTEAPNDAFRLGMCHAAAEEGLLRADSALGTLPQRRRAGDRPTDIEIMIESAPCAPGMTTARWEQIWNRARKRNHA